ncbi:S16 family serine protease [Methanoregula sp.]|uniref:S16 family serine protease n=1 Tax=Methanoregula sp. TaxID=2052170 RepID=UPI003BB16F27
MKTIHVLAALLVVSVAANIVTFAIYVPQQQGIISNLVEKTNSLTTENMQLHRQLDQANTSFLGSSSQLSFYRTRFPTSGLNSSGPSLTLTGYATIQAPAVSQNVVNVNNGGFVTQNIVSNGTMMNLSVEIQPGEGRVLVQTTPLMGVVFQDAANTAVAVAENRTGINLSGSDVIFSIQAENQISSVDGPSAGALMTLATIAAIENRTINPHITLTGTIDTDGHVGAIGGVIEKATAAKESGKTLFLLPEENAVFTNYNETVTNYGGFQLIQQVPEQISAKDYIENNIGINVTFVNSIDDILPIGLE